MFNYGNEDGLRRLTNLYIEASRGAILGAFVTHVFGRAHCVDTADGLVTIWDGVCDDLDGPKIPTYTFSTEADITDLTSSNSGDVGLLIMVVGLDVNWRYTEQTIAINGHTVVSLDVPLVRVTQLVNRSPVGGNPLGSIYLTTAGATRTLGIPDDSSTVRGIIRNGDNQSAMAIYSVPDGYDMFITEGWANLSKRIATSAEIKVYTRYPGEVSRIVHTFALNTSGSSGDHRPYDIPLRFGPKEDLWYKTIVEANDTGVSAGFHAVLMRRI